jgi:hypothetical protein
MCLWLFEVEKQTEPVAVVHNNLCQALLKLCLQPPDFRCSLNEQVVNQFVIRKLVSHFDTISELTELLTSSMCLMNNLVCPNKQKA